MNKNTNLKSVKSVNGGYEITLVVDNGFVQEEITWTYTPEMPFFPENVTANAAMNNPLGYLILGLLQANLDDSNILLDSTADAVNEMQEVLG